MWKLIKRLFGIKDIFIPGAILPTQEELDNAIHFEEIVRDVAGLSPTDWRELDLKKLPSWVKFNQNQTSECVPTSDDLMDSIIYEKRTGNEVKFSSTWKYWHRVNKPEEGTGGVDIGRISQNVGALPYDFMPTPQTEAETNNVKVEPWMYDVAKNFRTDEIKDIIVPIKNIDTLVSIQKVTDKPIMVWFYFGNGEWTDVPNVSNSYTPYHHSVVFVPKKRMGDNTYGLYKGEKAIIIQDSWDPKSYGIDGKRVITESFLKARNTFARYKMRFKFEVSNTGEKWDGSMVSLQKCLRSVGYFPTNIGLFEALGPATKQALLKWKVANGLSADFILDEETKALLRMKF